MWHSCVAVNSPWATVGRTMSEIVHTFKVVLHEARRPLTKWVQPLPMIQRSGNAAYSEKCIACPYKVG